MSATLGMAMPDSSGMPAQATEDQMLKWLWFHYRALNWIPLPQVTVGMHNLGPTASYVGEADEASDKDRRIDMLLARRARNPLRTGPLETMAVEVKVTRADFMSDVRQPEKQAPWRSAATRHAYAVPAGLVQADEVPAGSGLLWIDPPPHAGGKATVRTIVKAPFIPDHKPRLPFRVVIALLSRVASFEATTRGWVGAPAGAQTEADLRAELVAARARAERADRELEKANDKALSYRGAYALATPDGVPCRTCGHGVRPLNPKDGGFRRWRHLEATNDEPCAIAQRVEAEQAARDEFAAAEPAEREWRLRVAHRHGFNGGAEVEPWRAWLPKDWKPAVLPVG